MQVFCILKQTVNKRGKGKNEHSKKTHKIIHDQKIPKNMIYTKLKCNSFKTKELITQSFLTQKQLQNCKQRKKLRFVAETEAKTERPLCRRRSLLPFSTRVRAFDFLCGPSLVRSSPLACKDTPSPPVFRRLVRQSFFMSVSPPTNGFRFFCTFRLQVKICV